MDDDQFQGNLSVQGGNPEPIESIAPANNVGASAFVLENADNTSVESDTTEEQKEPEPQSEMSRRMDEILGSFDDGIATAGAISSGKGKIIQGTAVRADAPKPDFANGPVAGPVQAEVTVATEGVYDTSAAVPDMAQTQTTETAPVVAPVENTAEAAPTAGFAAVAPTAPVDAPAAPTPSFTGVPRSNIEQAAAEQAARDAVAAENNKKIDPKILIGMVVCILVIIASGVVIAMKLIVPKGPRVEPDTVHGEPEEKPNIKEDTEQRIGTPEHGYVDIPSDWERLVEGVAEGSFAYADDEQKNKVILSSVLKDATNDARSFATAQFSAATAAGYSLPQMSEMKVSDVTAFQVYYYIKDLEQWTFKFIFEAADNRVHCVEVVVTDNTSPLVNSVPESWSLNQNEPKQTDNSGNEDEKIPQTDEDAESGIDGGGGEDVVDEESAVDETE